MLVPLLLLVNGITVFAQDPSLTVAEAERMHEQGVFAQILFGFLFGGIPTGIGLVSYSFLKKKKSSLFGFLLGVCIGIIVVMPILASITDERNTTGKIFMEKDSYGIIRILYVIIGSIISAGIGATFFFFLRKRMKAVVR